MLQLKLSESIAHALLMHALTGANIVGPVFLLKNILKEQRLQFHYRPFQLSIFCHDQRRPNSAIAAFMHFQYSSIFYLDLLTFSSTLQTKLFTFSCLTLSIFHLLRTFYSGRYSLHDLVRSYGHTPVPL